MSEFIDIVFDKIPSHDPAVFIEVENDKGASISLGAWINREDGYAVLRFPSPDRLRELALSATEALEQATDRGVALAESLHEATNHAAYWERKAEELAERVADLSEKLSEALQKNSASYNEGGRVALKLAAKEVGHMFDHDPQPIDQWLRERAEREPWNV